MLQRRLTIKKVELVHDGPKATVHDELVSMSGVASRPDHLALCVEQSKANTDVSRSRHSAVIPPPDCVLLVEVWDRPVKPTAEMARRQRREGTFTQAWPFLCASSHHAWLAPVLKLLF